MASMEWRPGKVPQKDEPAGLALILAGIVFPFALAAWALSTHNGFDNIRDYGPVRDQFTGIVLAGAVVLFASLADLWVERRSGKRFPSMQIKLIALLSVVGTVAVAAYILLPQILSSGDVGPQVLLAESESGSGIPGYAISFYTEKATENTVEWGANGGESWKLSENAPSNQHWFALSGLEAGKEYWYSINGKGIANFSTVPARGEPIRFAASGDPHFGADNSRPDLTEKMLAEIKKPENNYSIFFLLGDSVQHGFSDSMWKEALASFSKTSSSVPFAYTVGNHDALFGGLGLYDKYLCPPGIEDPLKECYTKRIDAGNVHFLILDLEWEVEAYTPEQKEWLTQQLAGIPKEDWTIVMSHTFYYSSGSYMDGWSWYDNNATIRELVPLFEENGVDMVFSGHKHDSEILEKNGITYVVIGSFGGVQNPERAYVSPESIWYKQGQYGFADVEIKNSTDATIIFRDPDFNEIFRTGIKQRD